MKLEGTGLLVRIYPILIEVVDAEDKVRAVLPELDEMLGDGLIALEKVEVVVHRTPDD